MDLTNVSQLLLAVAIAVTLKELMEPGNVLKQLGRLKKIVGGKKEKSAEGFDLKPNSLVALGLGVVMLSLFTAVAYFVIGLFDPTPRTAIVSATALLVIAELMNGVLVDKVHSVIREMIDNGNKK